MHRLIGLGLCLLTLVVGVVLPPSAALAAAPVATGAVDYQIWMASDPGQAIVLGSVKLPQSSPLPAQVRIAVPSGMRVDWAGEILGGDSSADIARPFEVLEGDGGQFAQFEISQSREAQIDCGGTTLTVEGSRVSALFTIVQAVPADVTGFSVRVPPGVSDVSIEPPPVGAPEVNAVGESLYTLPGSPPEAGQSTRVSVAYSIGASTGTSGSDPVVPYIGVAAAALVLAIAALVIVVRRRGVS